MGVSQDEPTLAKASSLKDGASDEPEEELAISLDTIRTPAVPMDKFRTPTAPMDTTKKISSVYKEFPDGFNAYGLPSLDKLPIHALKTPVDETQAEEADAAVDAVRATEGSDSKERKVKEMSGEEVEKCVNETRFIKEKKMWFDTEYRCTYYFNHWMGVTNPSHCKLCPQSFRTATQLANHYTKKHVALLLPSSPYLDKLKQMVMEENSELEYHEFETSTSSSSSSSENHESSEKDKNIEEKEKPEEELDLNLSNGSQSSSSSAETIKTQRMSAPVEKNLIQSKSMPTIEELTSQAQKLVASTSGSKSVFDRNPAVVMAKFVTKSFKVSSGSKARESKVSSGSKATKSKSTKEPKWNLSTVPKEKVPKEKIVPKLASGTHKTKSSENVPKLTSSIDKVSNNEKVSKTPPVFTLHFKCFDCLATLPSVDSLEKHRTLMHQKKKVAFEAASTSKRGADSNSVLKVTSKYGSDTDKEQTGTTTFCDDETEAKNSSKVVPGQKSVERLIKTNFVTKKNPWRQNRSENLKSGNSGFEGSRPGNSRFESSRPGNSRFESSRPGNSRIESSTSRDSRFENLTWEERQERRNRCYNEFDWRDKSLIPRKRSNQAILTQTVSKSGLMEPRSGLMEPRDGPVEPGSGLKPAKRPLSEWPYRCPTCRITFTGERALELHLQDHRVVNVSNEAPTGSNLASTFGNVSNFTLAGAPSDGQTISVPAQMFMTCANGFVNVVTCTTIPASNFNQQMAQISKFQQPPLSFGATQPTLEVEAAQPVPPPWIPTPARKPQNDIDFHSKSSYYVTNSEATFADSKVLNPGSAVVKVPTGAKPGGLLEQIERSIQMDPNLKVYKVPNQLVPDPKEDFASTGHACRGCGSIFRESEVNTYLDHCIKNCPLYSMLGVTKTCFNCSTVFLDQEWYNSHLEADCIKVGTGASGQTGLRNRSHSAQNQTDDFDFLFDDLLNDIEPFTYPHSSL